MSLRTTITLLLVTALVSVGFWRIPDRERHYVAIFAHASGAEVGDEVRVAGIGVGEITSIELDHGVVEIGFTTRKAVPVTRSGQAAVKLATILGQHYLELEPGSGELLAEGGRLPLASTESAYTLDRFTADAADQLESLDTARLGAAVDTLTESIQGDPGETGRALSGITAISRTIVDRQDQLDRLISSTRTVTDAVHAQEGTLMRLLDDSDLVAAMITARRDSIIRLLRTARSMLREVRLLVRDNEASIKPTLTELGRLMSTLEKNRDNLDATLRALPAQSRYFANATGNGPWIEVFAPDFLLSDDIICVATLQDCR